MSSHAKAPTAGSTRSQTSIPGRIVALAALAALMALAFTASAQAVTYAPGTSLATGKQTTSAAVNQSTGDLYVFSLTPYSPA